VKEGEDSNDLIIKLEVNIPKLQTILLDGEKVLEETREFQGGTLSFLTTDILEISM
jgi:hypothetical protein